MCGIAGIFSHSPDAAPVDPDELLRMRDRMLPRGPDGEGLWVAEDRRVALAHRRLAILDLTPLGAQPMQDPETGTWIVFNGEIYNFGDLRDDLESRGIRFQSHCDTEVLLALYREVDVEMLQRLRGMFAFALWDASRRELFMARDHLGIKPLYWSNDGRTFRFASQVKALLAGGAVDDSPDAAGAVGFFLWGSVPDPFTLYRGIRALPAGHGMVVRADASTKQWSFFDLASVFADRTPSTCTPAEAADRLRKAVSESVRYHLISDVPVGVFLSAGIDSSTIAAHAASYLNGNLHTLSLGFREFAGTASDETILAGAIATSIGSKHQECMISSLDFEAELERILDQMDQPSVDGINTYFVCREARRMGWKVALSGLGGDELFRGYPSFRDLPRRLSLVGRIAGIPGIGRVWRLMSRSIARRTGLIKLSSLLEYSGNLPSAYRLARGLFLPWEISQFMDRDAVRHGLETLRTTASLQRCIEGVSDQQRQISCLEMRWYMLNQLLRDSDWASMAHSLELRVPLVDVPLLREVVSLGNAGHAPGKHDLFRTASLPLPEAILHRQKTGFGIPVYDWFRNQDNRATRDRMHGSRAWARRTYSQFFPAKQGGGS